MKYSIKISTIKKTSQGIEPCEVFDFVWNSINRKKQGTR